MGADFYLIAVRFFFMVQTEEMLEALCNRVYEMSCYRTAHLVLLILHSSTLPQINTFKYTRCCTVTSW